MIPMNRILDREDFSCSFCGKLQNEVQKLIAGPSACICNECMVLAGNILLEENMISIGGVDKLKEKNKELQDKLSICITDNNIVAYKEMQENEELKVRNQELQGKLKEVKKYLIRISDLEMDGVVSRARKLLDKINGGSDESK